MLSLPTSFLLCPAINKNLFAKLLEVESNLKFLAEIVKIFSSCKYPLGLITANDIAMSGLCHSGKGNVR